MFWWACLTCLDGGAALLGVFVVDDGPCACHQIPCQVTRWLGPTSFIHRNAPSLHLTAAAPSPPLHLHFARHGPSPPSSYTPIGPARAHPQTLHHHSDLEPCFGVASIILDILPSPRNTPRVNPARWTARPPLRAECAHRQRRCTVPSTTTTSPSHRAGQVAWPPSTAVTFTPTTSKRPRPPVNAQYATSLRPAPDQNQSTALPISLSPHPLHRLLPQRPALHARRAVPNLTPLRSTLTPNPSPRHLRAACCPLWHPTACSRHPQRLPASALSTPRTLCAQLRASCSPTARRPLRTPCLLRARPTRA